jgi:hypothetical protein
MELPRPACYLLLAAGFKKIDNHVIALFVPYFVGIGTCERVRDAIERVADA